VIDLGGRIVIGDGDTVLDQAVHRLIDEGGARIVLNMEAIEYMDTSGIVVLVACKKRAKSKGGDVKLVRPSRKVLEILSILNLHLVFEIFEDESKAIDAF
jgi:anti-sigma B factor antagonist